VKLLRGLPRSVAIVLVFTLSCCTRIAGVGWMNQHLSWNLVAPDTKASYDPIALSLARGQGYARDGDHRSATLIAPGFPLYLGAVYRVFGYPTPAWLLGVLNALMGALLTLVVLALASRTFGTAVGMAAAVVFALDPWSAFWSAFVLKEPLAVLLFATAVWALYRVVSVPRSRNALLFGVLLGCASLTRFATLGFYLWALVLLGVLVLRRRMAFAAAVRVALVSGFALGLMFAPWLLRNYELFGEPIVSPAAAGSYFYVSNGPGVERAPDVWGYSGLSLPDRNTGVRELSASTGTRREYAVFRYTLRHVLTHPLSFVKVAGARVINMWRPTFQRSSRANQVVLGGGYCVLMVLALVGGISAWRNRRQLSASSADAAACVTVLSWTVLFYLVLHFAFWSEIRYRQYPMPFITVFAGLGASIVLRRLVGRHRNNGPSASARPTLVEHP
jgi:4-amino-4-deoxy-L-arabinose transferase-like glycosyltransferase